jgi:hypothetical protein
MPKVVCFEELSEAHLADTGHAAPAGVGGVGGEQGLAGAVGEPEGVGEVVVDGLGGGGWVAGEVALDGGGGLGGGGGEGELFAGFEETVAEVEAV